MVTAATEEKKGESPEEHYQQQCEPSAPPLQPNCVNNGDNSEVPSAPPAVSAL